MMPGQYVAPSGETIEKYKDGPNYIVTSSTETEIRWHKQFRNEEEANVEFERWRK
jgi:hypothetical protein